MAAAGSTPSKSFLNYASAFLNCHTMNNNSFPDAAQMWDKRYGGSDFLFGTRPNLYLESKLALFQGGKTALAVADGEGRNSVWLAQQGLRVDAFDISAVGVGKAKKLAEQAKVKVNFQVCDCNSWAWQADHYDYVIAIFVQFAAPEMRARLFGNMIKTLKPGGYLILQGYTPKQLEYNTGGPGILENLYTEELLRSSFSALEIIDLQNYETVLNEGSQHSGMSALIGMTAKKQ